MMDARLEELEIRSAHQDRAVEQLSQQIVAQQRALDALTAQLQQLRALVQSMRPSEVAPLAQERPPPHY